MRRLRTQSAMLSEEPVSQDPTQSARSRSRYYSFFRRHRGLRAITPGAQKDRDEVRTFETHPEARSTSTARPARRPRRVCSGRHRAESATARIAGCSATTHSGSVHCVALELRKERQGRRVKAAALNERPTGPIRYSRLLQQNLPRADIPSPLDQPVGAARPRSAFRARHKYRLACPHNACRRNQKPNTLSVRSV